MNNTVSEFLELRVLIEQQFKIIEERLEKYDLDIHRLIKKIDIDTVKYPNEYWTYKDIGDIPIKSYMDDCIESDLSTV